MSITRKIYVQKEVKHTISIQESDDGETYLFLVYQVADVIAMDVQTLIKDFDDSEKSITLSNSQDKSVEIILITEIGLYKLLDMVRTSSQPAMLFQRWIIKTLTEMRVAVEEDDYTIFEERSLLQQEDEVNFGTIQFVPPKPVAVAAVDVKEFKYGKSQHDSKLKQFAKKEVFYTCKLNQMGKQYLIKMGRTCDLAEQVQQNGRKYGGDILILDVFESSNMAEFERRLCEQTMIKMFYEKTATLDGSKSVATYMLTSTQYKEMIKMFRAILKAIDDVVVAVPAPILLPPLPPSSVDSLAYETEKLKVENNKLLLDQRKYELKTKMIELKMMELQQQQQQQQQTPIYKKESSVYSAIDDYDDNVSALGQGSVFSACEKYANVLPTKTRTAVKDPTGGAKRRLNSDLKKK